MANISLNHNALTRHCDALFECLLKAEALAQVALLTDDFFEYEKSTINSYLWVLSDLLSQAKGLSQQSLDELLKALL